jgi:hypothetical protein
MAQPAPSLPHRLEDERARRSVEALSGKE